MTLKGQFQADKAEPAKTYVVCSESQEGTLLCSPLSFKLKTKQTNKQTGWGESEERKGLKTAADLHACDSSGF